MTEHNVSYKESEHDVVLVSHSPEHRRVRKDKQQFTSHREKVFQIKRAVSLFLLFRLGTVFQSEAIYNFLPTMEPESMSEQPQCPSPAPVKLTWGEIMDAEDNEMENVEPFCFYNPWTMDNINQVEEQKAEEQAKVQQLPVRNTKLHNERLSKNNKFQSEAISNFLPTVEPESMAELPQCTSPAPVKLTWGEIMDAEDTEMENVEPFSFYNPWSMDIMNQVEEQKAEEQKVEKQKVEEQKVEKQARVQQLPVSDRKLPNERLCKNKKTVKLLLRNLDCNVDDGQLQEEFRPFGTVISAEVNMENGHPKGTGFVIFASPDEARNAIMKMSGRVLGSRPVYVSVVQSKEEQIQPNPHQAQSNIQPQNESPELRRNNQQDRNIRRAQTTLQSQDAQKSKVFVKNLDYSVDDRRLHEAFLPYGRVISAKVTVENGRSRGFGFVSFSSPNEAEKAIKEMNGRMMGRKPLYVMLANNHKQRKASLTQTECRRSSGPTEPHTRPHSFLQRVHSHRRPSVAPATR
ncbi:uncharacterized protein LOC131352888 [Hemibagrus wyckioides]|uniref:uncharacterized protein LOC131352888 n=1 Tax=Hemibagrus wyckioides TaxID=337641 RepID=UPI00266C57E2|nr:uncharacterized protein LOC131352888 [Hemibagrus wyckioides]